MQYEIKELPEVRVAYLRYKGPFGAAIGEFWKEVFTPWQKPMARPAKSPTAWRRTTRTPRRPANAATTPAWK
jgi:DNA gyrase inhibitor GyrI